MPPDRDPLSVLIASGTDKGFDFIARLLLPPLFEPVVRAKNAGGVKRLYEDCGFDLVIINAPLPDDFGIQLALDIAASQSAGVLLLVKSEHFEQTSYIVENRGILTVAKPAQSQTVYQAVKLLTATRSRLREYEKKAATLEMKMDEIRLVNRAKWLLISHLSMDEDTAHRHIEKQAMDRRVSTGIIAREIVAAYEN